MVCSGRNTRGPKQTGGGRDLSGRRQASSDDQFINDALGPVTETSLCFSESCQNTYGGTRCVQSEDLGQHSVSINSSKKAEAEPANLGLWFLP